MAEAAGRIGLRVIERTERFTLLGADARHGKLTLFDAGAPRERGALERIGLRVSALEAATRSSTWGRDSSSCWSRRRQTPSSTSTTSRSFPRPRRCGGRVGGSRLLARRRRPAGGRRCLARAEAGRSRRDRAATAQSHRRPRRLGRGAPGRGRGARRRDRGRRRRAEHARALRLGPGPREARVHRAQALVLIDLTIAGAGMAGLTAAARARELGATPVVLEKGHRPGGSMLLSSGVVWRHRSLEDFHAECPDGEPRPAAPDRRGARRRARLAGVARCRADCS